MAFRAQTVDLKSRIPHIKELFHTRRYVQCASLCELLLTRSRAQVPPLYIAYLNFYLALCHDTIARETAIRNRQDELDIAERHYVAALTALAPLETRFSNEVIDSRSPTSSVDDHFASPRYRRSSDATSVQSDHSASTTATSHADEDLDTQKQSTLDSTEARSNRFVRSSLTPDSVSNHSLSRSAKRRPSPIVVPTFKREPSVDTRKISEDLSSFTDMIKAHLASVRSLRSASVVPISRWPLPRSRPSTGNSRSEKDFNDNGASLDQIHEQRKKVTFRPRFDPTSVQALCREAMNDL